LLSGASYPVSVAWSVRGVEPVAALRIGDQLTRLSGEGKARVDNPNSSLSLVGNSPKNLPQTFALHQNYPNPFNPATTIACDLPLSAKVALTLFNLLGQRVRTLVDQVEGPGYKSVKLDASLLSSGVYYYRLDALPAGRPAFRATHSMVILK